MNVLCFKPSIIALRCQIDLMKFIQSYQYSIKYFILQELLSTKNANRLKKRLCIAFVILVLVGLCIAGLIYYGAFKRMENNGKTGQSISLSDVLENRYYARHNNASWISNDLLLFKNDQVCTVICSDAQFANYRFFSQNNRNYCSTTEAY